jgi:integration host factor subunit alpha
MDALSKAVLVDTLCDQMRLSRHDARLLVERFFELMRLRLSEGHSLKLSGFGNFVLRDKDERPGRNPKTGEDVAVSARRVVTFRSGLKLKGQIDASRIDESPV